MQVPFVDLKIQYNSIKKEIDAAISKVLKNAIFIDGQEVTEFEQEFAAFLNAKYCIAVNSGTDALILGMRALNLEPGDEVIIPANTFIATALAATQNGLKPVFVDIDEEDNGINLVDLKRNITNKTKAVIAVHLYGRADKIDAMKDIIKKSKKDIYFIEDAAQAHGTVYKQKKVGNDGIFSVFSFYPGKNLGAYGDGGAIVTNDEQLARQYRLLREYGQTKKYFHDILGVNSRLDTMQAAVLKVKLRHLEKWNDRRIEIAARYRKLLKHNKNVILPPTVENGSKDIYHVFVIRTAKRDQLQQYLKTKNITTLIHYPVPLHLQKAFDYLRYKKGDFPIAEKVANEILSLPMFPELTDKEVDYVAKSINNFFE